MICNVNEMTWSDLKGNQRKKENETTKKRIPSVLPSQNTQVQTF